MDWCSWRLIIIREILTVEPYQYKASTVKRGNAWTQIADILSTIPEPVFKVNQRSVRERYSLLEKAFLKKNRDEENTSGINSPELTNNERGIEDIVEKTKGLQFRSEMMITLKFSRRGKKQLKLDKKALKHLAKLENEIVVKMILHEKGFEVVAVKQLLTWDKSLKSMLI